MGSLFTAEIKAVKAEEMPALHKWDTATSGVWHICILQESSEMFSRSSQGARAQKEGLEAAVGFLLVELVIVKSSHSSEETRN